MMFKGYGIVILLSLIQSKGIEVLLKNSCKVLLKVNTKAMSSEKRNIVSKSNKWNYIRKIYLGKREHMGR